MKTDVPYFLDGGGDMGARMRTADWAASGLGATACWPSPLRTMVATLLASNQPMFIAWGAGRVLLYNDPYAQILGSKHPDALGRDFLDVWHEIRTDLAPIVAQAHGGEPVQMDDIELVMHRHGYAEETHFSFFYSPIREDDGRVAGMFCACTEITVQVLAERRLRASEARHRGVLANMDEAFVLMDRNFRFLEFNQVALDFISMQPDELLGRSHWEAFPDSFDAEVGVMYRQVLADGCARGREVHAELPDGRRIWTEVRAYAVEEGIAVFFRDVTARRDAAEAAALTAERVQLALDAGAIVGTWVWTVPSNHFVADERFAASFGLDVAQCRDGLPLESVVESIHPDDRERVGAAIAEAMGRGGPYRCQYRVRQHDGAYRWVEANGRVELDAQGRAQRFPGVLLDHEPRRRMEVERDRANALLRTFIDAVPGVVYAKDQEGRFLVANRGTAELLGLPQEAFLGLTDADVLAAPEEAAAIRATDRRIMDSGCSEQVEERVQRADGSPAVWLSTKSPLLDEHGEVVGLIGASIDITDRKRMEDALRVSEQRSALALEVAQLGTWTWDVEAGSVDVDARARQIWKLDADAPSFTLGELAALIHPEDRPRIDEAVRAALAPSGSGDFAEEFRWRLADGSIVWTLSRGQVTFEENDGGRRPRSLLGSIIDVTERRHMVDALQQADRRKDEFLAMLAHELRNPLAPIGTAAQLLQIAAEDPQRVRQAAGVIGRQVAHMTEMVDDLLDVSRVTRGLVEIEREPVDLRGVLAAATEQAEPLLRVRGHRLVTSSAAADAIVVGDRQRLVQVVSNLLNNAAKYTPQGGLIELELEVRAGAVLVRVSDNGIGIDEALLPRVFDLFTQAERTPDRVQGGLGIGLALVRSIVQLHGGTVAARSGGAHQGCTVEVCLPAAPPTATRRDSGLLVRRGAPRRVLIVDDNADSAMTLAAVLESLGHATTAVFDPHEALRRVEAAEGWDVFILDIGMPGMTGYELASRLRLTPAGRNAVLIALTGYGHAHDRVMSRSAGFDHHIVKPADLEAIQRMLEEPAPCEA